MVELEWSPKIISALVGAVVMALVNGGIAIHQYLEKEGRVEQKSVNEMAGAYQDYIFQKLKECEAEDGR